MGTLLAKNLCGDTTTKTPTYGYCMTPYCEEIYKLPHAKCTRIDCYSCGTSWCIKCKVPYHNGQSCQQYQQDNIVCLSPKHHIHHDFDNTFKWTACKHRYCTECAANIITESLFLQKMPKCIKCLSQLSRSDTQRILGSEGLAIFHLVQQGIVIDFDEFHQIDIDEATLLMFGWFRSEMTDNKYIEPDIPLLCVTYYDRHYFVKSNIINHVTYKDLIDLLAKKNIFKHYKSTKRIYCGSIDGFDSTSLYKQMYKYSNNEPTILLIESNMGCIFGAYLTAPWQLNGNGHDLNAFIFSFQTELLLNTQIFDVKQSKGAVCYPENHDSDFLISFGRQGRCSIFLGQNCDTINSSYCDLSGITDYKIPKGIVLCGGFRDEENDEFVGGIRRFTVRHLEIHQLEK